MLEEFVAVIKLKLVGVIDVLGNPNKLIALTESNEVCEVLLIG